MKSCDNLEIGLKSYFLGPQAENSNFQMASILEIVNQYASWRKSLFPFDGNGISLADQNQPKYLANQKKIQTLLHSLSIQFQKEIPQFSPRYLGHMFSELTLPGLLGHLVALLHNPNNISEESSQVGLKIEREAIAALCKMFYWPRGTGHFTSGGTIANLEALLRMRARLPAVQWHRAKLLTSASAHYSWKKNLKILGFAESAFLEIPLDKDGRMSVPDLEKILLTADAPLLGLVSLYGSTEAGTVDDIESINQVIKKSGKSVWHHCDGAYGGFFAAVEFPKQSYMALQTMALKKVDSLTLDPHKLGYVPYGCGAFICRDSKYYSYTNIDAPYIQFKARDAGVQSIEGSRPATGAAATWLTSKTLGFHKNGLGKVLQRQLMVKKNFQANLKKSVADIHFVPGLDLNIICWTIKTPLKKLSDSNKLIHKIFADLSRLEKPFYVSKTSFRLDHHRALKKNLMAAGIAADAPDCAVIRMTLMNPFIMTKESQTRFIEDFIKETNKEVRSFKNKKFAGPRPG